ncbi:MAG: dienelactone hydrolase family protein [Verrucomicrobiales bacterium]|nr:dienelactone hydrolase family protein [Verrucomicrobiales bacterium]
MRILRASLFTALLVTAPSPALFGQQPPTRPKVIEKIEPVALPGTQLLTMEGDLASNLVAGVDRFLLRKINESVEQRAKFWHRDFSSVEKYHESIETNRQRLAHILGVRDARPAKPELAFLEEIVGPVANTISGARGRLQVTPTPFSIHRVRWKALDGVNAEGLLLHTLPRSAVVGPMMDPALMRRYGLQAPTQSGPGAASLCVIAIPDADQTPEQIAGLVAGLPEESQFARRLAEAGCQVLIPTLINRQTGESKSGDGNRGASLSNREFLYRPAFELGRHIIGYEIQKVLAGVDWFSAVVTNNLKIGVMGWGEGGMLALYSGALDSRIDAVCVSGYFASRQDVWQEPIYRNVFGLLERFGDAEIASLIAPDALIIEVARGPELIVAPGKSGGPGRLVTPKVEVVRAEVERAKELVSGLKTNKIELIVSGDGTGPYGSREAITAFFNALSPDATLKTRTTHLPKLTEADSKARHHEQMREINDHTQKLLAESPYVRQKFMSKLDAGSVAKFEQTVESYRDFFYKDVIGKFDDAVLPPNVRSRKAYEAEKWTGYEVVLDVYPDVIAYGILLLPNDLKAGERRPVVVCQHGLEGRPQHVIVGDQGAYHDFAARLAERGFVTFSPQNLYIFTDRFRSLQRKANPLGKTLFSIIVPQHQQIVDWLKAQPFADPKRIAFYGLSYGGKTAMRVPPLVKDYCLSICSADFNEWVWKNASTKSPYSYVWTGEYEIFEFDLGSTFNYAEMAALIAPRPFMVERGHFDGVAPDETVFYEFAKVKNLYAAKLGLGERCELETFVGPHTINGKGTFDFLHKHLNWPKRE